MVGNAAEAVAAKLDKKLKDNLIDARTSLFRDWTATGRYSFHRPELVLVDRAVDMSTPLHHTWTYQALAHDVLPYNQQRVTVSGGEIKKDKGVQAGPEGQFLDGVQGEPIPSGS